jgi:hypothetical protein
MEVTRSKGSPHLFQGKVTCPTVKDIEAPDMIKLLLQFLSKDEKVFLLSIVWMASTAAL